MRVIKMYCDRCGKEFEMWNYNNNEVLGVAKVMYDKENIYLDTKKDLCESCYKELEDWFGAARKWKNLKWE